MKLSKTIQILILATAIVLAMDVATRVAGGDHGVTLTDQLVVKPVEDGVYILGNSMFKTGVDVARMQAEITERDVRFNYYDGHYTSLWYLIAEGALGPSTERPELVVWGFRPRYALLPAFRQNRPNSTESFEFDDLAYDRITGGSISTPLVDAQSVLEGWSAMFSQRSEVQDAISRTTQKTGLEILEAAGKDIRGLWDRLLNGDSSIADEIVRAATGGAVQLTEEQVVDGVGDFIAGPILEFADGFIPLTASSFEDSGLGQVVVIWKPATVAIGNAVPDEDQFVEDAIDYFKRHEIPYIDFYHDDRIDPSMFASGDHYNADGRAKVTAILTDEIRRLLSDL